MDRSTPAAPLSAGASMQFSCHNTGGALLALMDREAEELSLHPISEKYLEKRLVADFDKYLELCPTSQESGIVRVVKGAMYSGDYHAIAVSSHDHSLSLAQRQGVVPVLSGEIGFTVCYSASPSIDQSTGHCHKKGVDCKERGCKEKKSMSVFIRSILARRIGLLGVRLKAAAKPKDLHRFDDDEFGTNISASSESDSSEAELESTTGAIYDVTENLA